MSESGDSAIKSLGIFSSLQAATEAKFFLLSATFILLIDNVFLKFGQPGLLDLAVSRQALEGSNLALKAILIFVMFSFLTSLLLPIFVEVFEGLFLAFVWPPLRSISDLLREKSGAADKVDSRRHNTVLPGELRQKAHRSKESYYLDLYEKYEDSFQSGLANGNPPHFHGR